MMDIYKIKNLYGKNARLYLVFIFLILLQSIGLRAQTLTSGYGAPTVPLNVANGSATFKVKIVGSASACSGPSSLTITMPTGYVYVSGSASVTAGSGSVSETSVSGGTAVLSVSSIPAAPDSTVISYQAYAGCGVIGSSASNQVSYSLSGCIGTVTALSNVFNALNAKLNIINITNSAYTGSVGDIYTRAITIRNDGFGSIDTVYLDDISGSGLAYQFGSVTTSVGTIASVTTLPGGLNRFKVKGAALATGQSITITETMKIVSCSSLNTNFDAWYGPNAVECTGANSTTTAGANIDNSLVPNIVFIQKVKPNTTCLGTTYQHQYIIKNTGTGKATNLTFNLTDPVWLETQYSNNALEHFGWFDTITAKPAISLDGGATFSTATYTVVNTTTKIGTSTTFPAELSFTGLPTLAAGDSFILKFYQYYDTVPKCAYDQYYLNNTSVSVGSYQNTCGTNTYSFTPQNINYTAAEVEFFQVQFQNALDAIDTKPFKVNIKPIRWEINDNGLMGSDAYYDVLVTLPAALVPNSLTASDIYIDRSVRGLANLAFDNVFFDASGVLHLRFTKAAGHLGIVISPQDNLVLNTTVNCALATGGTPQISVNSVLRQTLSCPDSLFIGGCISAPVNLHCPAPCVGGLKNDGAYLTRTNFGLPDNDNNSIPDGSGTIDLTKVNYNGFLPSDTVDVYATGHVVVGSTGLTNFDMGTYVVKPTDLALAFSAIKGRVDLYRGASHFFVDNLPVTTVSAGANFKLDLSPSTIGSITSGFAGFINGDSIVSHITLTTIVLGGAEGIKAFPTEYYLQNSTTGAARYACDTPYTAVGIYYYLATSYGFGSGLNTNANIIGCTENTNLLTYALVTNGSWGYSQNQKFPYEIRNVGNPKYAKFQVPTGIVVDSVNVWLGDQRGGTGHFFYPTIVGDTAIVDLGAALDVLFGSRTYIDEGFQIITVPYIHANCNAPAVATMPIWYIINYLTHPSDSYQGPMNATISTTGSSLSISSSSPNLTVSTSTAVWEVQVTNSSAIASLNNVWLAKDAGISGVTITSLQQLTGAGGSLTGSPITPVGGVYQLGNISPATAQYYRITATYTSCVKDSILMAAGNNCSGYPSTVAAAICKQDLNLTVVPQPAALQLTILNQPSTAPVSLCSSLDYEIQVLNPALGDASNLSVTVTLPASGGVVYQTGSYQLSVPSGSYVSIADANVTSSGSTITFNVPSASLAALSSTQTYKIKFSLLTTACDFVSGQTLRFRPLGKNPCGQVITGTVQQSNKVTIIGTPTSTNAYTISSKADSVVACGSGAINTNYKFKLINQGPAATSSIDGFDVDMPSLWQLNPASIVFSHNPSSAAYSSTSGSVYNFTSGTGLAVGDSIVFTATIIVPAASSSSLACGLTDPITENATVSFTSTCVSSGTTCTSKSIVSNNTGTSVYVNRPIYTISGFTAAASPGTFGHPFPGDSLQGTLSLQHSNTTYVAQNVQLSFYNDVNSNGVYDAGDVLIGSQTFAVDNASSQTFNYSVRSAIIGTVTSVVAVANFNCSCNTPQAFFSGSIALPLAFTHQQIHTDACAVQLNWTYGNNNISGFVIERSNNGSTYTSIATLSAQSTSYIDVVPQSGTWYYRIKAKGVDGSNTYSTILSAQTTQCLGNTVNIYPNPAQDQLQIVLQGPSTINHYELVDALGRVLLQGDLQSNANNKVAVSGISVGVYVLRVLMDENVVTKQIQIGRQ